jgi:CarD family transcriptional regulator
MCVSTVSSEERIVAKDSEIETKDKPHLRVGETVVYGAHGVGVVAARERRPHGGVEQEWVVLDLAAGLRVTLPLEEAALRLRPIADADELAAVQRTLAQPANDRGSAWTQRLKEQKAKLAGGLPSDLAELVRDGAGYEAAGTGARLGPAERGLYLQARQLLALEISTARNIEHSQADSWIQAQLAGPNERGNRDRAEATTPDVREVQA